VCTFKFFNLGLFLEPIYNQKNQKPQAKNLDSKVVTSTTRLQLATKESVVNMQGSKGVAPKTKLKLKPLRAIGR
jgi:hypothetical protein